MAGEIASWGAEGNPRDQREGARTRAVQQRESVLETSEVTVDTRGEPRRAPAALISPGWNLNRPHSERSPARSLSKLWTALVQNPVGKPPRKRWRVVWSTRRVDLLTGWPPALLRLPDTEKPRNDGRLEPESPSSQALRLRLSLYLSKEDLERPRRIGWAGERRPVR